MRKLAAVVVASSLLVVPRPSHAQDWSSFGVFGWVSACALDRGADGKLHKVSDDNSVGDMTTALIDFSVRVDVGNGWGTANGNLRRGTIGAAANSVFTPARVADYPCVSQGSVTLYDALTFRNTTGAAQWQQIDIFTDGMLIPDYFAIPDESPAKSVAHLYAWLDNASADAQLLDGDDLLSIGMWVPPGVSTHTFSAQLAVTAWNGAIADYSHTARTTLGTTAGVEYVGSASGVFLSEPATTATPEPATLGSVGLGGLLLLGARARRRRA